MATPGPGRVPGGVDPEDAAPCGLVPQWAVDVIAATAACLARRGWAPGCTGDVSVRLPNGRMAITARDCHKSAVDAAQIVQLDPSGQSRSPWMLPGQGAASHATVYRLSPGVGGVIQARLAGAGLLADPADPHAPRAAMPGGEATAILDGAEALLLPGDAVLVWDVDPAAALDRLESLEFALACALARRRHAP